MKSLEPEIVEFLLGRHGPTAITGMERVTLSPDRSSLERVILSDAREGSVSYVIKRLQSSSDWISRATSDERLCEYRLLTAGIYRALPSGITSRVTGGVEFADGGVALIMPDVSDALVAPERTLTEEQAVRALEALAKLHSAFYGFPARLTTGLGLCTISRWLTLYSPTIARPELESCGPATISEIVRGWTRFADLAPGAWSVLEPLLIDPTSVVRALRACPDTLVHGDPRAEHLGFTPEEVILLDWGQTLRAPGALDLASLLSSTTQGLPVDHNTAIEIYRSARERLGRLPASGERWERELTVGLLAATIRSGWAVALAASSENRDVLEYWVNATMSARQWLETVDGHE